MMNPTDPDPPGTTQKQVCDLLNQLRHTIGTTEPIAAIETNEKEEKEQMEKAQKAQKEKKKIEKRDESVRATTGSRPGQAETTGRERGAATAWTCPPALTFFVAEVCCCCCCSGKGIFCPLHITFPTWDGQNIPLASHRLVSISPVRWSR